MMEGWVRDLRYALRLFSRSPGFALVAVASLAIGMGAGTAIFTFANELLLSPLPVEEPDRLIRLHVTRPDGTTFHSFSYPNYVDFRDEGGEVLQGLVAEYRTLVAAGPERRPLFANVVTSNFFSVLGVEAAHGRLFSPSERPVPGGNPVVVLGHGFWQRQFGSDPGVVGSELELNGHSYSVLGVLPESFRGTMAGLEVGAFVPVSMIEEMNPGSNMLSDRGRVGLEVIGRLQPGVDGAQAQAVLETVAARLASEYPDINKGQGIDVRKATALPAYARDPLGAFLLVLLTVVGLVLLIACTNVATVLLARAVARQQEIAIRASLGASRCGLVRQLLVESAVLFVGAGAAGLLIAQLMGRALLAVELPIPVPVALDLSPDLRVLLVTAAVALLTGLLFGLAPALTATRPALVRALRTETGLVAGRSILRRAFLAAQVGLCLLLLVAGGLFLRALGRASALNPGFEPKGLQLLTMDLSTQGFDKNQARTFYQSFLERVNALPDVESAALADFFPLALGNQVLVFNVEGVDPPPEQDGFPVDFIKASPGYLETLGVPLLRGRQLTVADAPGAPPVAVVNQALADRFWPGKEAVGERFSVDRGGEGTTFEVVGVARTTSVRMLGEADRPYVYLPYLQVYENDAMTLHVRPRGDAEVTIAAVRRELAALDRAVAILDVSPMTRMIELSLLPQRLASGVAGSLGIVGLFLASMGVYGTAAYTVGRRTREIGLRVALGASRRRILELVARETIAPVLVGLATGIVAALVVSRLLTGLLYGLSPSDPLTFGVVTLLLASMALIATLIPARRALRIEPSRALRWD